jgi:hypothetical protein
MTEDEQTAELLLMREYYTSLAGAHQDFDPLSRETLRIALIVGNIDELVKNLVILHESQ